VQIVATWSVSTSCQKTHQHLFAEQVDVCCIPTTTLYLTSRQVCVWTAGIIWHIGWCVPWQLVFLFGRREMMWKVNWSVGVTLELFCLLTDQKEPPAQKPQYSSCCRGRLKGH
jgi:hypothetical protein